MRPLEEYELTQHYQQWREDLDRAASLGIKQLRWGVPWYRVEPQPGVFDWTWVDQVLDYMVNTLHIEPILDLVHYGTPLWMQLSFVDPQYVPAVARYAREFARRYGHMVKFYTPLNEPTVNSDFCCRRAEWPPYLRGESGYVRVMLSIARGVQETVKVLRQEVPDAVMVAVESMHLYRAMDKGAEAEARTAFLKDVVCWDLARGAVNRKHGLHAWLMANGATVEVLRELRRNAVQQDIFGVNYYPWSSSDLVSDGAGNVQYRSGPNDGRYLADVLRQVYRYVRKPLYITETSSPGDVTRRALWMSETIDATRLVRGEGVPVIGYTWFPIITMIGWEYRTSTKPIAEHLLHLGLWDSAFDDSGKLVRHETPLVASFRDWIRRGMKPTSSKGRSPMAKKTGTRVERDSMGEMRVPAASYFGASTQRAILNFPISDMRLQHSFIRALALIKFCAAEVNHRHGKLDARRARAIKRAALEVASGKFDSEFVVDVFQTGSGTSTNMNANEVIANRAAEFLGGKRGSRDLVHPNDHVNMGMSSNDAIPTATHVAALIDINEVLLPALRALQASLEAKAAEFMPIMKTGRTHLQDGTPMRLGQEFSGYAAQIANAIERLQHAQARLSEVALGGTAVGTGVNTRADFAPQVLELLSAQAGVLVVETRNHFQAQSTLDEVVHTSGALRTLAISVMKIANDIRWLGSGPRAGFGELQLPEVQPGSSIMPGKVNPVIAESVCQVAAQVIGNDAAIGVAGASGNFELNVMQPVAAYNLLQSISLLARSCDNFRIQCVDGLRATEKGPQTVEQGLMLATALVPAVGYDAAAAIAKEAAKTGRTIREVAREKAGLSEERLSELLDAGRMTAATPAPQVVLGITGSIATGKSAVGKMLQAAGVHVIDTDDLSHELQAGPNPTFNALLARFGDDIVDTASGAIDRKKLGAKVFGNEAALRDLNAIMHPAIEALLRERLAARRESIVGVMVPLLFEAGWDKRFKPSEIWCITADEAVQVERLMKRNGLTREQALQRIATQMPQRDKARRSTRRIDNSGTLEQTQKQVKSRLRAVRRKFGV
jgi:fumarate hydratase class II